MAAVQIKIKQPAHDSAITGNTEMTFLGEVTDRPEELSGVPLYFRWYSSLFASAENRYSINVAALTDPAVGFTTALGVGTHAISLAVSDRPGETPADVDSAKHGGVTGGSEGDAKCLLHVFRANLIQPIENEVQNRASGTLSAIAPLQWGKEKAPKTDPPQYEVNSEYEKINRVQYRWQFTPTGDPAGRQTVDFIPEPKQYIFVPSEAQPPIITYQGALPGSLSGAYRLTLFVEDSKGQLGSHQMSVNVQIGV